MQKISIKQQAAQVMAFARKKHPEPVSFREVMVEFEIGMTKARNLCQLAAEMSDAYEYHRGKLRYTGDPKVFDSGFKNLVDAFQDPEGAEEPVPIGEGEAHVLAKILTARPTPPEDKGFLKMPKKRKEKWTPNDHPYRRN